ncbi:MAG: J domain-containing protein [Gammaproteobacteria bacterium]|nr:J domain-containing protein [Gammaproteobacteria bacterium]
MGIRKKYSEPLIDFYEVLGVPKYATEKGIHQAFRKKAHEYHPDLHPDDPDATRKFAEVAKAYRTLKSEEKRNDVDARIISDYCMSFLGSFHTAKQPDKKLTSEFLRILGKHQQEDLG